MLEPDSQRRDAIRALLQRHVEHRLKNALSKIQGEDSAAEKKRQSQHDFFHLQTLLESGAECATKIQLATHIAKATHPSLKVRLVTNLNILPTNLKSLNILGTHALGKNYDIDATGDALYNKISLEAFLLLRNEFEGNRVLDLLKKNDEDAINALGGSKEEARRLAESLLVIDEPRCQYIASHSLTKQIFWPVGKDVHKASDPRDDTDFHMLAPLFASSLIHSVYLKIQDDRFSEDAKAARDAKKDNTFFSRPVREYPQLAVQKLGGTKPQNISQLNSERRGDNFLLASLPPVWRTVEMKPLLRTDSMFIQYSRSKVVRQTVKEFLAFLKSNPPANLETRNRRNAFLSDLIEEFLQFSAQLRSLQPGWSQTPECQLSSAEKHWLDPDGVTLACTALGLALPTETAERVSALFANWVNAQLRDPLPMDDATFLEWRKQMNEQIKAEVREGLHDD